MSAAAQKLAVAAPTDLRVKRGPVSTCAGIYEPDIEDAAAIEEFRKRPRESWRSAQHTFDTILGIEKPIPNDKFRYHWNRGCGCWPDDLRRA